MLKTKKFRRLLAGLLAVLMLSVCLPVGAFATGGEYTTISVTQKYTDGSTIANINVGTIPYEDGTTLPDVGVLSAYFADTDSYTYTGTYDVSLNGAAANTYGPNSEKAYDYAMVKNATMDITIYYDKVEVKPADTTTITITQKYTDGSTIANINVGTIPYEDGTILPDVGVLSAYFADTDSYTYTGTYDVSLNGAAANTYGPNSEKAYDYAMVKNATMDITIYYDKVEVKPADTTTITITQKYTDGSTIANINVGTIPYEDGTILPDVGVLSAYFADTDSYTYTGTYDVSLNGAAANTYGPNSEKAYDLTMVKNATMDITIYYEKVEVKPADTTTITIAQKYTDGALIANINVGTIPYEDATTLPNVGVLSAYFGDTDSYTYTGTYDVSVNGAAANTYGPNSEKAYDLTMVKNATMDITIYYEKVEPATPSEDVNFRVEYVDENGQSLMAATNVATTYNDFEPSQKLADLLAKEIAEVEAEGYKQVAFTVVYEDGYETAPLNEPYVVPDYDGKTIKVYFAKVENYEDVNVRFEFVDMDGNTIQPATNYATSLSDSIVGPKVSEVLADEIDKLAADGYDFDHYAWVLADGTETVLTDPVVVPDYDGTTIKVYFVKVEEYEDVHVRFEFVDMDGNSVLPATNYATCLSDSVIGPKVNDVLADELSTMEGRNYNFHHYARVYSDGTETELDNDVIVVPDHDGTTIKVYFEAVKTEPSDPSTGDNTTTVTGKDEHPDIAEAKANGTWGAPTATPAAASTIPQTGDSMPVVMLIVIALVAAGAVGGLVVLRKRSRQ